MLRYINFLSKTMIRKKGIWITAIIGFVLFAILTYFEIKDANQTDGNRPAMAKINNLLSFDFFIPFVFGTLVTTFIVLHCFKEGESDGTELIIVAKPITRAQIIIGKFISTLLFLIAYQLACMIIYILMSVLDNEASTSDKVNFVLSLTIGGFIVQLFAVGVITLVASLLGKIGTVVISIMFAALIPIISFIAFPISGGYGGDSNIRRASETHYLIDQYDEKTNKYTATPIKAIYNKNEVKDAKKNEKQNNYRLISKIDPWYQWGRFYSLFISRPAITASYQSGHRLNWHLKKAVIPSSSIFKIMVDGKEEQFAFFANSLNPKSISENKDENKDIKSTEYLANYFWNNGWNTDINIITTKEKYRAAFEKMMWSQKYHEIKKILNRNKIKSNNFVPALVIKYLEKNDNVKISTQNTTTINDKRNQEYSELPWEMKNIDNFYSIETSDYVSTVGVVIIWTIIGLLVLGASTLVYAKRDFK